MQLNERMVCSVNMLIVITESGLYFVLHFDLTSLLIIESGLHFVLHFDLASLLIIESGYWMCLHATEWANGLESECECVAQVPCNMSWKAELFSGDQYSYYYKISVCV